MDALEITFKVIGVLLAIISGVAAFYNIFTARGYQKQVSDGKKIDEALALGQQNKADIAHLKEQGEMRERHTRDRLEQIGNDVAYMKDLVVKWLLTPRNS